MSLAPFYAAIALQTLLYGIYLVLSFCGILVLHQRKRLRENGALNPVIIVMTCFLFVLLAIHYGMSVYASYRGLIALHGDPAAGYAYLANNRALPNIVCLSIYVISQFAIDFTLVYRLWIIWNRSWLVTIGPILAILFCIAGSVYTMALASAQKVAAVNNPELEAWYTAIYCVFAAVSVACTILIAVRLSRDSKRVPSRRGMVGPVLWILVESVALYTLMSLMTLAFLLAHNSAYIVFYASVPVVLGISSNLLVVRVGISAFDTIFASSTSTRRPRTHVSRTDRNSIALFDFSKSSSNSGREATPLSQDKS